MNIIKSNTESVLSLKRILFNEIKFTRSTEEISDTDLNMTINKKIEYTDNSDFTVTLLVNVSDSNNKISVSVNMIGIFSIENGVNDDFTKSIAEKNTVAIMFPYIRSQISLITTQPDMKPIVIPPINVSNLIDNTTNKD